MKCFLLDGKFNTEEHSDFSEIAAITERNRKQIYKLPLGAIIALLSELGREIIRDKKINGLPGVTYIALWLKKDNLKKICKLNYFDEKVFENFKKNRSEFRVMCPTKRSFVSLDCREYSDAQFFFIGSGGIIKKRQYIESPPTK